MKLATFVALVMTANAHGSDQSHHRGITRGRSGRTLEDSLGESVPDRRAEFDLGSRNTRIPATLDGEPLALDRRVIDDDVLLLDDDVLLDSVPALDRIPTFSRELRG